MISDTLSEARDTILDYLQNSTVYRHWNDEQFINDHDKHTYKLVYQALEAMEYARIALDQPPSE